MTEQRKGARSLKDIPVDILMQLNTGQTQTVNLMEWLAIDQQALLTHILKQFDREHYLAEILSELEQLKKPTINSKNAAIGKKFYSISQHYQDDKIIPYLQAHVSDMLRCWACYSVVEAPELSLEQRFNAIRAFAADSHFGVREVAWMAIRPFIIQDLKPSLAILEAWVTSEDSNIRRFASEASRPRGVWCNHIDELKQNPEQALAILEPLKHDPEKYVQDSVGNWLNDASKSQPDFVLQLCKCWKKQSDSKATTYIIKKALRTIEKAKD